jgi:basic membrane protein A
MVVDLPNVQSVVFKEHEGSFLVGLLAGMVSKSGKVGFVGGMDIPLIRRFACGYLQGVKHGNAQAEVLQNMTGTTGAAWNDPVKGGELAKSQIDRGAACRLPRRRRDRDRRSARRRGCRQARDRCSTATRTAFTRERS